MNYLQKLATFSLLCASLFTMQSSQAAAKQKNKSTCEEYDYVIVGCGTGGSALAAKLSDPNKKGKFKNSVLVLEAGANLTEDPAILFNNIFAATAIASPNYSLPSWATGYAGGTFMQIEGIMWGGSSGHNSLLWYRASPEIYDEWAAVSGDNRWAYNNLLPNVMIPIEHYTPNATYANPNVHGFGGSLFNTQSPPIAGDPGAQAIALGTGVPLVNDLNDPTEGIVGVGANIVSSTPMLDSPDSVRSFGGNAFLTGIENRGIAAIVDANGNGLCGRKLKIKSQAHASRVLFSKSKRAKAVEYTIGSERDKTLVVKARKAVIVCCGAISTPALLQRSGIGDSELLTSLNIPVVADSKHCGQHLENHVGGLGFISDVDCFIFPPYLGNAFIGLPDAPEKRTLQLIFGAGDVIRFFAPQCVSTFVSLPPGGTGLLFLDVVPKSQGHVKILNNDPFRQPEVAYNNYSDGGPSDPGSDANKVVQFYHQLQDIAAAGGGYVSYPTPEQYAAGDDSLFNAALITSIYAYHQSGTCRMGTSIENGVVDGRCKVFGVNGLYVGDNSAAPRIQDCNTQTQAYYIGYELARILRGEG